MSGRFSKLVAVALLFFSADATAGYLFEGERKRIQIQRIETAPVIDGRLDDAVWQGVTAVDDFHQTTPINEVEPTETTIVRVAYDVDYLYIAAEMLDSEPERIQARQMIQGGFFYSDDRFWVNLDSFNSKRNDYFFQVNPNGIRRDALRENNSSFIDEWEAIWQAESVITERGWTTEIAIPFKSISFSPDNETWGINFGRNIVRKQEFILWSSNERQDWPAYSGEISGIADVEQGLGLDVVPSVNLRRRRDLLAGGSETDFEPSLDVRYRITPSLSATLTLNTDFSTAEVDERQVALDRFSLFFPEKREFFLQDAGIFEFGNIEANGRPFFSRRIGLSADGQAIGIDGGVKLTGRIGDLSIGALGIRQEAGPGSDATDIFVARGAYNVLDESAVGFVLTHGDPLSNDSNTVAGLDFIYRNSDGPFGEILFGHFWAQQSDSENLDGDDSAFGARLEIPSDKLKVYLGGKYIDENFNPALGFVNRRGIRQLDAGTRYRYRPPAGGFWRAYNLEVDFSNVDDLDGNVLSRQLQIRPSAYSNGDDFLYVEFERNREWVREPFSLFGRLDIAAGEYKFDRYRAEFSTGAQRPLRLAVSIQDGDFFAGTRLEKYVELEWKPSAWFSTALSFSENVVDLPDGSFTAHLASLRTDLAFGPRWSWSNFLQYDNSSERFGANSRLRYIPQAGRELLLVLNHGGTLDKDNSLQSTGNDLNLKVSYTFRY